MIMASVVLTIVSAGLFTTQTHVDITPEDITALVDELGGKLPDSTLAFKDNQTSSTEGGLDEDIYGDTSIASIEGENVELYGMPARMMVSGSCRPRPIPWMWYPPMLLMRVTSPSGNCPSGTGTL